MNAGLPELVAIAPNGCPQLKVPGGLIPPNGEIALGYLHLGYRPIPIIRDDKGTWVPPVKWGLLQRRPPTSQEVVNWWMKYPDAGIALVCGREAGLVVPPSPGRSPPHPDFDFNGPGGGP